MTDDGSAAGLSHETARWLRQLDWPPNEPHPDPTAWTWSFPSDEIAREYIGLARRRPEAEVRTLLRWFLFRPTRFGQDERLIDDLMRIGGPDSPTGQLWGQEFVAELFTGRPHVGVRWVLDLLPDQPLLATQVISAYLVAYWQLMPDGRIDGMYDAAELIRARYVAGEPGAGLAALRQLTSRQFEVLVCQLYRALGYECVLTPERIDGGRDVIATSRGEGRRHSLLIECKRHEGTLRVNLARELLGVVSHENRSGGVLVTTAKVSRGIRTLAAANHRIDFVDGSSLVRLLDEHLGTRWMTQIDRLVTEPV